MKRVLIVGSSGVIGSVLREGLTHKTTEFDLPDFDAKEYAHLHQKAKGHDVIVHLAWDFDRDGWLGDNLNPNNALISYSVYQAAVDAGVKRVIVASSVHVDKFTGRDTGGKLLSPFDLPLPDSPYGANKVLLESLGRHYADAKGLEVICIRFGGVNKQDVPPQTPDSERRVWLSHADCVSLVEACIQAEAVPYNYTILYGVSDNQGRIQDLQNPFGWQPKDGA